jgi:hypothetical protein
VPRKTAGVHLLFFPKKRPFTSDIFMDETMLAFGSSLAMIHDPRSLIVHGIYERGRSTMARRPSCRSLIFDDKAKHDPEALIEKATVVVNKWILAHAADSRRKDSRFDVLVSGGKHFCLQENDLDVDSHGLLHFSTTPTCMEHRSGYLNYVKNIPPSGIGRYAMSTLGDDSLANILPLTLVSHDPTSRRNDVVVSGPSPPTTHQNVTHGQPRPNQDGFNPQLIPDPRGPRLLQLLWILSSNLGLNVQPGDDIMVDRRILIATQWFANSLMAMPVIYTLLARSILRITPKPIDYHLEGLPYEVDNEMRYLSSTECGYAAAIAITLWLVMGRYAERRVGRTFERSMMEHLSNEKDSGFVSQARLSFQLWWQRRWDRMCPIFFQRRIFTPRWNKRTEKDVENHIASWRSTDLREHKATFAASDGLGVMTFGASAQHGGPPVGVWEESSARKLFTGIMIALGSFTVCSPHFFLNAVTVFCCSIGLGMSMSIQAMETGRGMAAVSDSNSPNARSVFRPHGLNTIVIGFFLVGHLVGSSGGILFLAEFVVTSVSLVLGGAGTISASGKNGRANRNCES